MSDAMTAAQPQLSGSVLLYKKPEPLTARDHSALGLKILPRPFNFVATTHVAPLTVQEFGMAATTMPIIFSPDRKTPLAVMAARAGENLFVTAEGNWENDSYIPAFVRRYPFVFAADPNSDQFVVCIDREAEMLAENAEVPMFVDGEPTDYTKNAIDFLQDFERQRRATDEFVKLVNDMNLLEEKAVTFTPQNPDGSPAEPVKVADYVAISEEKLNALPAAKLLELKNAGALPAIYAHLVSLLQWQRMIQRTLRLNTPAPAANA